MDTLRTFGLVGICGAAGAIARYGMSGLALRWFGPSFPYGTLIVNLSGCFLLGLLMHLATATAPIAWRVGLGAGFLGGLTTFSTFSFETFQQLEDGQIGAACGNVAANLAGGLFAVWAGVAVARTWW